jgi:hypothetical protein
MPMLPQKIDYIPLGKVPAIVKTRCGINKTRVTIYNWATKGRRNINGVVEKLKTVEIVNHYYTTSEWLDAFLRSMG